MAIKRFDDIDKKARELEAQAKKLRREKQAAKTKAYARARIICVARCTVPPVPTRSTRSLRTLRSSTGC